MLFLHMKIRYLVTDIDGTITDASRRIDTKVIEVIRRLMSMGIEVVLASGNCFCIVKGLSYYLGCSRTVIAENGGILYHNKKMYILGDPEIARKARDVIINEMSDLLVESWQNRYRYVDFAFKPKSNDIPREEIVRRGRSLLEEKGINAFFEDSGVAFHVSSKNVSKGNAVLKLCELTNTSIDEVVCIGDGETDISMLEVCPNSVALAHAPQYVKIYAKYVTTKPYSEGFLEAVKKIIGLSV